MMGAVASPPDMPNTSRIQAVAGVPYEDVRVVWRADSWLVSVERGEKDGCETKREREWNLPTPALSIRLL